MVQANKSGRQEKLGSKAARAAEKRKGSSNHHSQAVNSHNKRALKAGKALECLAYSRLEGSGNDDAVPKQHWQARALQEAQERIVKILREDARGNLTGI